MDRYSNNVWYEINSLVEGKLTMSGSIHVHSNDLIFCSTKVQLLSTIHTLFYVFFDCLGMYSSNALLY
jgi:hypothetical protein